MTADTLQEANRLSKELHKWQHIETRISCGSGFYNIQFIGNANKTMEAIEAWITDDSVIKSYHKFVKDRINDCEKRLEKL